MPRPAEDDWRGITDRLFENVLLKPTENQRRLEEQEGNQLEVRGEDEVQQRWEGSICSEGQAAQIFQLTTRKCATTGPYGVASPALD